MALINMRDFPDNREMALFKTAFNKAYRNGKTHNNPAKAIRKLKGKKERDRVLSDEEWESYYREAPAWFKPIALCAYLTAMRKSEILKLKWDRIDRKAGFIRLRPEETKTGEGRPIPIDPRLDEALDALPRSIQKDGSVFTRNGEPIITSGVCMSRLAERQGSRTSGSMTSGTPVLPNYYL